jgi:hypothetical protein
MWDPLLTATFLPTSYGTIMTSVQAGDASAFSDVRWTSIPPNGRSGSGETVGLVDLRELEVRAAKAREQAARAESALLDAQAQARDARALDPIGPRDATAE